MGELTPATMADAQRLLGEFDAANKARPKPGAVAKWAENLDTLPGLWQHTGDLTLQARERLLDWMFGDGQQAARLSVQKGLEVRRGELGYSTAPPLEKMLIEHLLTCLLHLQNVELRYIQIHQDDPTINQADHWERRLSAAQRRYLRAVEKLARIRRLQIPAVQVNVANEQVNVVGNVSAAGCNGGRQSIAEVNNGDE